MPLQATSGAASYDAFGGGAAAVPQYIEDVFSTYLYTGNGTTQTITNGIDLSTKGGLVWIKERTRTDTEHSLFDTVRGRGSWLSSDLSSSAASVPSDKAITSFNSNGFSLGGSYYGTENSNGQALASWTFRKQPKFFDIQTYTGDGTSGRVLNHSLGSTPGCIIWKLTSASGESWGVYHRSLGLGPGSTGLWLNLTSVGNDLTTRLTAVSSTSVTLGSNSEINGNAKSYVMYFFAHDAGGFGLTGTGNVVSCGSFATDGSGNATVSLGYEPQWILFKTSTLADDWRIFDVTRGLCEKYAFQLNPNTQAAEANIGSNGIYPTSTGFVTTGYFSASQTVIYVAIRRGPMKVPTSGTSVFAPVAYTGTNVDNRLVDTGILTDMTMARIRTASSTGGFYTADRLRGNSSLGTAITDAENTDADSFMTPTVGYGGPFSAMNGFGVGNDVTRQLNQSSTSQLAYAFQRAPSFFDEVCYTGAGSGTAVSHNLGVAPEIVIVKSRDTAATNWETSVIVSGTTYALNLDRTTNAGGTAPTSAVSSTTFTTTAVSGVSARTYVAYLFATCAGVSKVGSYTGTGALQTVNCGFTSGARFVLIKRTDSTGDWWTYDSARGITSGNDPYLFLNSTAAEVTSTNYVDTDSTGFKVTAAAPAGLNASGGTYIFLAIA